MYEVCKLTKLNKLTKFKEKIQIYLNIDFKKKQLFQFLILFK